MKTAGVITPPKRVDKRQRDAPLALMPSPTKPLNTTPRLDCRVVSITNIFLLNET